MSGSTAFDCLTGMALFFDGSKGFFHLEVLAYFSHVLNKYSAEDPPRPVAKFENIDPILLI